MAKKWTKNERRFVGVITVLSLFLAAAPAASVRRRRRCCADTGARISSNRSIR